MRRFVDTIRLIADDRLHAELTICDAAPGDGERHRRHSKPASAATTLVKQ
jgi:hypothetical protein